MPSLTASGAPCASQICGEPWVQVHADVANVVVLTEDADTPRESHIYSLLSLAAIW